MADELTVARAQGRIARSMGWRRPTDWPAEYPITELLNEVGEWFVGVRDWNFLVRPPAYLEVVEGQSYCELPDDFTQHLSLDSATTFARRVTLEDPAVVGRAQADVAQAGGAFVACFNYGAPTTAGPMAKARLELGPIPDVSDAQAFVLTYKGGWVEVNDAGDHIVLPKWVRAHYIRACSAWLGGLEKEAQGSIEERLDRLVESHLWQSMVERDDNAQQDYGQSRNGVGSCTPSDDDDWPFPRATGAVPIL